MSQQPLQGKVAIVTGAGSTRGMGHAMALALLGVGARVTMLDYNAEWLEESAADARKVGGPNAVLPIVGDVSEPETAEMTVRRTIDELGGLHILINNAGINPRIAALPGGVPLTNLPIDVWQKTMGVNASGPFYMARAALPHMLAQGWGRIIGVTTSLDTMIRIAPDGPAKAAHEALVSVIARQVKGTGVTANVLTPGGSTATNLRTTSTPYSSAPAAEESGDQMPPEIMQPPLLWLVSPAADGVNSQRIIAQFWDEELPIEERLEKVSSPAGWPQLGRPGTQ